MLLERIYDHDLAQASYLIGCQAHGEALVVDPRRDITEYLDLAEQHGMRITAVTETHIHADYLSGTRELAAATGARIHLSGEGGPEWQYEFEGNRLFDGDVIRLGNISVQARHTPGHTPEHLSFLITDGAFADTPGYLLSGDFIFAGDLGRPDLLDEAAGGVDTRFAGARQLYHSLREVFLTLPDHVQVYPGHGAGSACGKALGALPATTVGYERANAWWAKHLAADDIQGFSEELLQGQPDAHAYFGRMKRQNRRGPAILGPLPELPELANTDIAESLTAGEAIFVDTRDHDLVHQGTVAGALNIPGPGQAATFGGWAHDPEREDLPLILLAPDRDTAAEIRDHLLRVGIDRVKGYTTSLAGLPAHTPTLLPQEQLTELHPTLLLDVRNLNEHLAGTIPGATQLSAGKIGWHLDQLPTEGTILSFCQSGRRNSVAASVLRRAGFEVLELAGSYAAWQSRNLVS